MNKLKKLEEFIINFFFSIVTYSLLLGASFAWRVFRDYYDYKGEYYLAIGLLLFVASLITFLVYLAIDDNYKYEVGDVVYYNKTLHAKVIIKARVKLNGTNIYIVHESGMTLIALENELFNNEPHEAPKS